MQCRLSTVTPRCVAHPTRRRHKAWRGRSFSSLSGQPNGCLTEAPEPVRVPGRVGEAQPREKAAARVHFLFSVEIVESLIGMKNVENVARAQPPANALFLVHRERPARERRCVRLKLRTENELGVKNEAHEL